MENRFTLRANLIDKTIEIIKGFDVDYSPELKDKDFNNNGKWGKIINKGEILKSVSYNPNKTEPNFGRTDYEVKMEEMKKEIESLAREGCPHCEGSGRIYWGDSEYQCGHDRQTIEIK